ncbi:hypothetical protein, partial [uncultured Alistipes sp.]|uniref:hypothetical protein n=1 Tax=uncultured Alistipes sp. TaxID=538949 RepID=UPI00322076D3
CEQQHDEQRDFLDVHWYACESDMQRTELLRVCACPDAKIAQGLRNAKFIWGFTGLKSRQPGGCGPMCLIVSL